MRIIPFGEVKKNLFETSKKYKLINVIMKYGD